MPRRTQVLVALLGLVAVSLPLTPSGGARDIVQALVEAGCLVVAWHHVRRRARVRHHGWTLLVGAVALLATSDAVAALEVDRWHLDLPLVPSHLLALVGYLLLAAAVLQLDRRRSLAVGSPGGIEALIFAVGALTPVLVFLVLPALSRDPLGAIDKAVTIAYALADLVVAAVVARLLLADGRPSRSSRLLSGALVASVAGDAAAWALTSGATTTEPTFVRVLWLLGFVLFAAGVAHPSMEAFTSGGSWSPDAPRRRRVWLMGLGQAMPAFTLLFAWAFDATDWLLVVAVGGLVVSLLVSLRMHGLLAQIGAQSTRLADLARSDELTGLHNRRSWNFELARACRVAAADGRPLSVGLLDLDLFKRYNDSYGHPAGDRLLTAAAQAWRSALRPDEVLARYGGEEFAVLFPGTSVPEAVRRLDEIRGLTPAGQTFSAGVAPWVPGVDPEQAVADADTALYEAKRLGRDRVVAFAAPRRDHSELPYALRTVLQPIVRSGDLSVTAYEALSRFDPATEVEAIFEQAHADGYGDLLEGSAILSALRFPDRPAGVEVFVNVSELVLRSAAFWQVLPQDLIGVVVELHERRHGLDDATVLRMLDRFRERGARICLDDVVATDPDLERVAALHPDVVKIDRSVVAGCDADPVRVQQLRRLLACAREQHAEVCAEGVETLEELQVLRDLEVPLVQGYLLGRPEDHWVEPLQPALRVSGSRAG